MEKRFGEGVRMTGSRTLGLTALAVVLGVPLSACQALLPRDDTPRILPSLAALPDAGASAQRLDANGYPLLGAKPRAATGQVADDEVTATQSRYANVERRSNGAGDATYVRQVRELEGVAAQQQARGEAIVAANAAAETEAAAARAAASSRAQ